MKSRTSILAATAFLAAGAALAHGQAHPAAARVVKEQKPWGIAGDAKRARTIEVSMTDAMRFTPARLTVRQGETIRFVVRNDGAMLHEMVVGTRRALDAHAALMAKFPGMEHDEPYMTHVKPGEHGALVWNFNRPGEFHYACLIAGHYQAGMVGAITVTPAQTTRRKSTT